MSQKLLSFQKLQSRKPLTLTQQSAPFSVAATTLMVLCCSLCLFLSAAPARSSEPADYKGWEKGSEYDTYYNYKERDSLKGKLVKFQKVTPLPDMATGTAFILDEGGEKILVHICPESFISAKETGLKKGIKTKVKGSWAAIGDKDVFIAAKIKQGEDFELKVRLTKDGTPFWTMTQEERRKEGATY